MFYFWDNYFTLPYITLYYIDYKTTKLKDVKIN